MCNQRCWLAAILIISAANAEATPPDAPVEILRERDGVPHILAKNEADALYGLGYVHGQDRLWQLEYLRRVGTGRLSEVIGPGGLRADTLFRTLGVAQSGEATWARYSPRHRALILAYVAGINAAADQQRRRGLPPEFVALNFEPALWRPQDVMVIAKVLGWSVDTNWDQELLRAQMVQKLGATRAGQLMPAYTSDGPVIVGTVATQSAKQRRRGAQGMLRIDENVLAQLASLHRHVAQTTGFGGQGIGSNNQVISGDKTVSRKPLLASDPHLPSQLPSIFYRVHLSGGSLNAIGATAVGMPGVLMGHNGRLAWGWTNANADTQDLYVERLLDGGHVEYNGAPEPLRIRVEVIRVKGQQDVTLQVRSTRHGPLVSDLVNPAGPALALRWAALDNDDDVGITANLEANKAENLAQFIGAFRKHKAHPQNMVFADAQGNTGYQLVGTVPIRRQGNGTAPVPGWNDTYEWTGYIPLERLPGLRNPREGFIATSNNKIASDDYPFTLSSSYAAPYRATRVTEVLQSVGRLSSQDLERLQADTLAVHARELLPALHAVSPANSMELQALELLRSWDYRMLPESAAAAVFEAWYIQLAETLFADELGDTLWRSWSDQMHMVSMSTSAAVRSESEWCDDVTTPIRENCTFSASRALAAALRRMAVVQGSEDVSSWQWSKAHRIVFFHQPFDGDPVLSKRFNRTAPTGGDKHTVNVASNPRWNEYEQKHLALYRQVIDLSDFSQSRWMAAPGQSGILTDPHYDDLTELWRAGESRPMLYSLDSIRSQAVERVELKP